MATIVRASPRVPRGFDPTVYPVEEKVGEHTLHRLIVEVLRPLVERWFRQRRIVAMVGADQFIYYQQYTPTLRVAPDIYVLPGLAPETSVASWKTWEEGVVPSFALEVVSTNWEKDYYEAPGIHAAIGVSELVIFDPWSERHADGVAWQVYRRVRGRPLKRVEASQGDRVSSKVLGCHLRAVGSGESLRLRLGTGSRGDELFPTGEEAALAGKEAALVRVATLEAQLRRRGTRSGRGR